MDFLSVLVFILPCYVANAVPVLLGGGAPLDFGAKWSDGRRVLGDTKTARGFVSGVAAGTLAGGLLVFAYPLEMGATAQLFSAFALALGALVGDAVGSFIKRRMDVGEGKPFLLDQIGFVIVGLVFAYPFASYFYSAEIVVFIVVLSYLLHIVTNGLANRLGLKAVPW